MGLAIFCLVLLGILIVINAMGEAEEEMLKGGNHERKRERQSGSGRLEEVE